MDTRNMKSAIRIIKLALWAAVPAGILMQATHATPAPERHIMSMPTVLITGSNRGIGLEFVRQLSARDWRIIATTRDPDQATELNTLAEENENILVEQLDVIDQAGIDRLAAKYQDQPIDILLLNAALGPAPATAMSPLAKLDFDLAQQHFLVNAIGPMRVSQAFYEHVKLSQLKLIIAISSDSGSFVAGSQMPALYHYKASKAALNMYFHTLAFETPRRDVTAIMMHPGHVGTNEMLAKFPGALKTSDSVGQMLTVIDGITPEDNGRFISYTGETMPW
jgi:NAD(P)-dependent dehydrogenase (short-subunit alcohol dehydrogenase family)